MSDTPTAPPDPEQPPVGDEYPTPTPLEPISMDYMLPPPEETP